MKCLKNSTDNLIEVDLEKKQLRRNPEVPLPEKEDDEGRKAKTVYCKGFEKENTTMDHLLDFFKKYDNVANVHMRTYVDKKSKEVNQRHFKGSIFVTFKDKASAEAFMALESVKNPEGKEELIRKWQADYFDEKQKEFEEKKAQRNSEKKAKEQILKKQDNDEEEKEENTLPKGAVLFMDGFKDDTMREHIKKVLKDEFDVENEHIAFVDFEKGQTKAYVRFCQENAAKELAEKIKEKDGKIKVNESEIEHKVLEGDEETKYLDKAVMDMKLRKEKNKGHKRRHGGRGGGRGGKRGRH